MMTQPKATKTETTFRQSCAIRCDVQASPDAIWAILTNASNYTQWNSTVTSLEGDIRTGEKLKLRVTLDPKRTFSPKVTKLEANEMVWSDGFAPMFRGVRTFTLTPKANGATEFVMEEVFSGAMLPLIKKSLPDFAPAFEAFARDLKRAAEGGVS
ncbi:MAG: SRPBCC family protein [Kofleriaceae bacterium]